MAPPNSRPVLCPLGPVMRDVPGLELTGEDRERLCHPSLGGVILFAENYDNPEQLRALVQSIHALRDPALLVCVDQEGGRVQRFRDGFVQIPPMQAFGERYTTNPDAALQLVSDAAFVLGSELIMHGIDLSFAPVLDLALTDNPAIGNRAFHADPHAVSILAGTFSDGLRELGLPAIGKHFPGHGAVSADSHVELPVDNRPLASLESNDLIPYMQLIEQNRLDAVMTAHIQYEAIESSTPTFSTFWLQQQLRKRLQFKGVVFSDDLHMQGAVELYADSGERGRAALAAGCDVLLICRDVVAADAMCEAGLKVAPESSQRLMTLVDFCRADRERLMARVSAELGGANWQARTRGLASLLSV